jgi:hypothetical protein
MQFFLGKLNSKYIFIWRQKKERLCFLNIEPDRYFQTKFGEI